MVSELLVTLCVVEIPEDDCSVLVVAVDESEFPEEVRETDADCAEEEGVVVVLGPALNVIGEDIVLAETKPPPLLLLLGVEANVLPARELPEEDRLLEIVVEDG